MDIAEKTLLLKKDFDDVYEAGKKIGWDCIQSKGQRLNYELAFSLTNLETFEPIYDIVPTVAGQMFKQSKGQVDLVEQCEKNGIKLDFSNCTSLFRAFYITEITRIGVVDCQKSPDLSLLFCASTKLHTIDKMIVNSANTYNTTFDTCPELVEIRFEGVIGNNISFSACKKLSHDSLISIIDHLETKASGTYTLTIGTTNLEKLNDTEKAVATQKGWTLA